MKITKLALLLAGAVALSVTAVRADTIVGTGAWQTWTAASLNENGTPFWDNKSLDGSHQNIGYLMAPSTPTYYGNSNGSAVSSETFTRGASIGSIEGTELLAIAGYAPNTTIGWYDTTAPGTLHAIYTAPASGSRSNSEAFTPSATWGLYIQSPGGTFYSNSALDSPNDNSQHFAIFDLDSTPGAEEYQIGIEDTAYRADNYEGHGDFNDFVMTLQSEPGSGTPTTGLPSVPEPTSLSILGIGAAGLLIRRRKTARN